MHRRPVPTTTTPTPANDDDPPKLPPRPLGPRDPPSPTESHSPTEPFVPLRTTVAAANREAIVLYVTKLPGSDGLLLTPTKPHNAGITDFDVNYGAYLLQLDDQDAYREEVDAFARMQTETPRRTVEMPRRVPAPAQALADATNAKRSYMEETALDQLLREEEERAHEPNRLADLKSFGEHLINPKPKALPEQNELRNLHQSPLAARGLVPPDARPMTLHRIGILPNQSRQVGEVAHMLDTWRRPRFRRPTLTSAHAGADDAESPGARDKEDSAGYIDMLDEAYEPFGTDVNYVSPSWIKVFTRRLFKWKGHFDEDFVMLSPWQGHLVFTSSKVRNNVICYHLPHHASPSERILVSELRLNVYPQTARPRRHHRTSSSDSASNEAAPNSNRHSGSFPLRARGISEPSPLSTVEAAQDPSARRDSRIARLLHKVEEAARPSSPTSTKSRSVSNAGITTKRDTIKAIASHAASAFRTKPKDHDMPSAPRFPPSTRSSMAASPTDDFLQPPPPLLVNASTAALSHSSSDNTSIRPPSRLSLASSLNEPADERMDLSLGQERLGGGLRGRDAKLAKIVIYGEGQQMLDLVVAANLVLFWRAFAVARGDL